MGGAKCPCRVPPRSALVFRRVIATGGVMFASLLEIDEPLTSVGTNDPRAFVPVPQTWTIAVIGTDVEIVSGMEKVFRPERAGHCSGHEYIDFSLTELRGQFGEGLHQPEDAHPRKLQH